MRLLDKLSVCLFSGERIRGLDPVDANIADPVPVLVLHAVRVGSHIQFASLQQVLSEEEHVPFEGQLLCQGEFSCRFPRFIKKVEFIFIRFE
jgi:hypothetical protein